MEKINYIDLVTKMLQEYNSIEKRIKLGLADNQIVDNYTFMKKVIEELDSGDKDIISVMYLEKRNKSSIARDGYFSRTTLYRRAKSIIKEIAELVEMKNATL